MLYLGDFVWPRASRAIRVGDSSSVLAFGFGKMFEEDVESVLQGRASHNQSLSLWKAALTLGYPRTIGARLCMARRRDVIKARGYPDRRGMGAQSDFIGEKFVPSEEYKTAQMAMVQRLLASGVSRDQVARMFSVPFDLLSGEKPTDK